MHDSSPNTHQIEQKKNQMLANSGRIEARFLLSPTTPREEGRREREERISYGFDMYLEAPLQQPDATPRCLEN